MSMRMGEKTEYTHFPEQRSVKYLEGNNRARLAEYEYYLSYTFQCFQT
jgi:hypothetical protein